MAGIKGQTGTPTNLIGPRTAKERADAAKRKKANTKNRVYFTVYTCSCGAKTEVPQKNAEGKPFCGPCMVRENKMVVLKPSKTYKALDINKKTKRKRK